MHILFSGCCPTLFLGQDLMMDIPDRYREGATYMCTLNFFLYATILALFA